MRSASALCGQASRFPLAAHFFLGAQSTWLSLPVVLMELECVINMTFPGKNLPSLGFRLLLECVE